MSKYSSESGRRADPQRIVDKIHRFEARCGYKAKGQRTKNLDWNDASDREFVRRRLKDNGEFNEAILPGFGHKGEGETARSDCGNPHPFLCDECGNHLNIGRTCSQSVCSRCAAAWVRDRAIAKSSKMRRVRKEKHQHTPDTEHQKLHHLIISPRLSWFSTLARDGKTLEEANDDTKKIVKAILDEMRAQGILIQHSFRGETEDGAVADESDDRGEWKQRLNSDRDWWGDVRDELAWQPHFHCIVAADFLRGDGFSDVIEEETGWVIHRIADDDGISLESDGAMARALTYSLSHVNLRVFDEDGKNNQSDVWEVGSFEGDIIKSNSRFSARPHDTAWADETVRKCARQILGLKSTSTECNRELPAVDEPDELARRVLRDLYPDEDPRVNADTVLEHIRRGNISVEISTSSGGGGNVTVRDAFGDPVGPNGFPGSASDMPDVSTTPVAGDGGAAAIDQAVDTEGRLNADSEQRDNVDEDCGCDEHHSHQESDECDGQLVPLEEAREQFLSDEEWRRDAPHVDEADDADREWPDDLEPWSTEHPGKSVGAGPPS